jgi:hypothetical protein
MSDIDGGNAGTTTDGTDAASQAATTDAGTTQQENNASGNSFSQADVDRLIADRLTRERGKFADYNDLKTKAAEFDKIQDANKSELEKANEALSSAQAELAVAKVERVRRDAADKAGLPAELHEFITATDPEEAAKQAKTLADKLAPPAATAGNVHQGARPTAQQQTDMNAWLRGQTGH